MDGRPDQLGQFGGPLEIASGQRVADRIGPHTIPFKPITCPTVERRRLVRMGLGQARREHIREEMMVAIPAMEVNLRPIVMIVVLDICLYTKNTR